MKRAVIIFIILCIATMLIPFTAVIQKNKEDKSDELVTIFSSQLEISISGMEKAEWKTVN